MRPWLVVLVGLVLSGLLSGCTAPRDAVATTAAPEVTAAPVAPEQQGLVATATRVVPHDTVVDDRGRFQGSPCLVDLAQTCARVAGPQESSYSRLVRDPDALFWRAHLVVYWNSTDPREQDLRIDVQAVQASCSDEPCHGRTVLHAQGPSPLVIPRSDLFLKDGEGPVRIVVRPVNAPGSTEVGPLGVSYHVAGLVQAFVAAAPPQVISMQG